MIPSGLRDAIERGNLVVVFGAGISTALSGGAPTSDWRGLIRSGIARAAALHPPPPTAWVTAVSALLELGESASESRALVRAASMVVERLERHGGFEYAGWLTEDLGELDVKNKLLARAIARLPFPILTTNFDTLLELATGRATATWQEPAKMQSSLHNTESAIGHLHGCWTEPGSCILTESSYTSLLNSEAMKAIEQGFTVMKSVLYVGVGATLADPNFSRLLDWHREVLPGTKIRHYRLCIASERDELRREHKNDPIEIVAYGRAFGDLTAFLAGITPVSGSRRADQAAVGRDPVVDAQRALERSLALGSILGTRKPADEPEFASTILPPTLLPSPPREWRTAGSGRSPDPRPSRLDSRAILQGPGVLLVVANAGAGLTSALGWLALEASREFTGSAPLYVDFAHCRKVAKPVRQLVVEEALRYGLIRGKHDPLPSHVLCVDNFSPSVPTISDRAAAELAASGAALTLVGCHTVLEDAVRKRLTDAGCEVRVAYLGEIERGEIRELARIASPHDYLGVSERVTRLFDEGSLAQTPFNAAILVSLLVREGRFAATGSSTALLERYLGQLLDRKHARSQSRTDLDATRRERLLQGLARYLLSSGARGASERTVLECFERLLETYGWEVGPVEALETLLATRVLRRQGGSIEFARASYLDIYVAKCAHGDTKLRTLLMRDPLRFAPMIEAYAALERNDARLLAALAGLLDDIDLPTSNAATPLPATPRGPRGVRCLVVLRAMQARTGSATRPMPRTVRFRSLAPAHGKYPGRLAASRRQSITPSRSWHLSRECSATPTR